jgi:hypothetical protein
MKKLNLEIIDEILENEDLAIEYEKEKRKEKKLINKTKTYDDEYNNKSRKKNRINRLKNEQF